MPFTFHQLPLAGMILVDIHSFGDERGWFRETYKQSDFRENGISERFVQENLSRSHRGVLRGLHFQREPHAQGKLVMVLEGEIFDVGVDIRPDSPQFGKWYGQNLSWDKPQMLWIPPGFAHGFCVLSEWAVFSYKTTAEYAPDFDAGIRWNDPDLGIRWPELGAEPTLSAKDLKQPFFREVF